MISRYSVALNGEPLSEIDGRILILNISHADPTAETDTATLGSGEGSIVTGQHRDSASVTINFELHVYSTAERQDVCQQIVSWAKKGGILTTNDRPGQRLVCTCEKLPFIDSARDWTAPLAVTFTARRNPHWEEEEEKKFTLSGKTTTGTQEIPGNIGEAKVTCSVLARGTLTSLKITAGSTMIDLQGISVASGGTVTIDYKDGNLRIRSGSTSLLSKRTGASSDDLLAVCGETVNFGIIANASVTATFGIRGCWS